jgi:hypothetical protein
MKSFLITISFAGLIALTGCETTIHPDLEKAETLVVVDAWLTSRPKQQIIKLTYTQPYFDNTPPPGIAGATVVVTNESNSRSFNFTESGTSGQYEWLPASSTDSIGKPGDYFFLSVVLGNDEFVSTSTMGRVPAIDSITFRLDEATSIFPDFYVAEFWAQDPPGKGDTYWIKAWKNDILLLRPAEINIAYDAGFTEGGGVDGLTFIAPIRQAISPFEADNQGNFLSPYAFGDSVYVEILSISKPAFNFLNEVSIQTDRPGGFAELFAAPFSNVRTNIINRNANGKKAVGFFNVGSVRGNGKRLVE